ncbi:MAG: hypothetical protein GXO93_08785 [FCB group bacterium]|nr:hypothetical protein [FCB group bacterium]
MAQKNIQLLISTPTESIPSGRGFYQQDESTLFVPIGAFSMKQRFFSYLESPHIRFDINRQGRLMFMEISVPRHQWQKKEKLLPPLIVERADIRWLNFREQIEEPKLFTNTTKSVIKLQFDANRETSNYYLADSVIAQVNSNNELTSIWVIDIVDDFAGKKIRAFRKNLHNNRVYSMQALLGS